MMDLTATCVAIDYFSKCSCKSFMDGNASFNGSGKI